MTKSVLPGLTGPYRPAGKPYAVVVELSNLLSSVANRNGLTVEELLERDNSPSLVKVRRQFAAEAHAKGFSLPEIGRVLHRHHTTVLNLLNGKGYGEN
jgi:chromosomal replication initiation ATPase DnaA